MPIPTFPWFEGRTREEDRVLTHMRAAGVFADLPPDTESFIHAKYSTTVPYHNRIHVLYGLAFMHKYGFPLRYRLSYVGHDAGHNGDGKQSPELTSAYHTYVWLNRHPAWLQEREIDPQDCAQDIMYTRFPYHPETMGLTDAGFMRTVDVFRIYSGMSYESVGVAGCNNLHIMMYESIPLFNEMVRDLAALDDREKAFVQWYLQIEGWYKRLSEMEGWSTPSKRLAGSMGFFFSQLSGIIPAFARDPEVSKKLGQLYTFLNSDVTLPEFIDFAKEVMRDSA